MDRKKYSKELKAQIALDAIKGQKTIAELASEYGVHANQISIWKKQLLGVHFRILTCNRDNFIYKFIWRMVIVGSYT